ncbi:unnamed protein product [Paramecium pentaurelia]|uniref:FCP1 homology domain-containing protein n=1 Tax=Paramecium pentaurelia TaxID=43138 RepID=A0A8S1SSS4_9CILI|nr:unnamed protein product [Paramecium pentaurelia]
MDNQSNSKSKFCPHNETDNKRSFFSEDEADITPMLPQIAKPSKFSKGDTLPFQTDDSDNTPKQIHTPTSPKGQNKLSKFKQKDHHIEKDSDIQFDSEEEKRKEETNNFTTNSKTFNENEGIENQFQQKCSTPKLSHLHPLISKSNSSKQVVQSKNFNIKDHPFKHLIYGRHVNYNTFMRFLQIVQSGLVYACNSLKGPSDKFLKSRFVRLKESNNRKQKILVLDLDETLIHSCTHRDFPHITITIQDDDESIDITFNVRPYCKEFIKEMSNYYTIYLFTASSETYAKAIVNHLDPKRQYITDVLCRNNCFETKNGFFIKDLRIITNRDLKDIVIIDNLPHSFGLQLENGIPILEWTQDPKDEELKYLQQYLIELSKKEDVRTCNREKLKLLDLVDFKLII